MVVCGYLSILAVARLGPDPGEPEMLVLGNTSWVMDKGGCKKSALRVERL